MLLNNISTIFYATFRWLLGLELKCDAESSSPELLHNGMRLKVIIVMSINITLRITGFLDCVHCPVF
jgi:hypothetical protein